MMQTSPVKKVYDALTVILLILTSYTIYSEYGNLPARVPTHFNFAGHPDNWGDKSSLIALAALPWGMTVLFSVLTHCLPRMSRKPQFLNIPHKEEFLKLPEEKRLIYWAFLAEMMSGILVGLNLLMCLLVKAMVRIACGEADLLPFTHILPAMIVIVVLPLVYLKRMITLPGKLIRGEE